MLEPTSVRDDDGGSISKGSLTTLPGDTYTYTFQVPRNGSSHGSSPNPGLLPRMDARKVVVGR